MQVLSTRDSWWMAQCEAALSAEGVSCRWTREGSGSESALDVPASDAERVSALLSDLWAEERQRRDEALPRLPTAPLILQPAFAFAVGMAVLTLGFAIVTGYSTRGLWHRAGALLAVAFWEGEGFRVVTAATLHADLAHALGNAAFFLVLAWAAGERLGPGVSTLVWLGTAAVGFAASLGLSDTAYTVGASGGLFGLLGAAAGHAVRHRQVGELLRRGILRSLGGAVLLLAFTAFSARANEHAHVGGFVSGVAVGALLPRSPPRVLVQALCAAVTMAIVWTAWSMALRSLADGG